MVTFLFIVFLLLYGYLYYRMTQKLTAIEKKIEGCNAELEKIVRLLQEKQSNEGGGGSKPTQP